ncbi:hypothetical protein [Hyalangium rubrum]|uniref:Uncharacterized protein n=1 Tax=Hyalangium rubrum TaxID=3103134 RepID=A0ABU5H510_9BACT|nr:hypothetical protein [Hyalangium sp. s54d21]MDY7228559.1 hypothetical protein [Hyalangium sp. s54d21]
MSLEPVAPSAAPVRKKTAIWPYVLGGVGVAILSVAALVGLVFAYLAAAKPMTVTEADRALLVTTDDLVPRLEGFSPQPSIEKLTKKKGLDGTIELEYLYDLSNRGLYLASMVTTDTTASSAKATYTSLRVGQGLGLSIAGDSGTKMEERDDLFTWGDESRTALITNKGKPVGNVFTARKGRHSYTFVLVGVYFDSNETLSDLLLPKLERLATNMTVP